MGENEGGGDVILFNAFVLVDKLFFAAKKTDQCWNQIVRTEQTQENG